ncbi:MAG: VWA domain-containing protein [Treponema sp.]|jgi:Ca-activated chloride channel family protein|nr:VWA domain-containing protein [Treponema sp.]
MTGTELDGALGFDRPLILLGLAPLVLFAILDLIRDRRYSRFIAPFALRYRLSRLCAWLFFGALILALAGPHWGFRQITEYHRGLDVVLALDLSHSMEVRDAGSATRLERAAAIGLELAEGPGFRLAAAMGRGRGILALPLTEDRAAVRAFLGSADGLMHGGGGTNLESLLDAASSAFLDDFPSRRIIVLLSDGESLSGSLAAAVDRAFFAGIVIAAVGLGTESGGPVPGDSSAAPVISRLRRGGLEAAAAGTGGIYIDGNEAHAGDRLRSFLETLAFERETGGRRRENRPRWRLFLVTALVCLGLSRLVMRKARNPNSRAVLLLPLILFYQSCAPAAGKLLVMEGNFYHAQGRYDEAVSAYLRAREYPEALPYAEYGLGTVYAALDEMPAALIRYQAAGQALEMFPAEGHRELKYRIPYNQGVALFWEGDYEGAVEAFREALEVDGGRMEAKRNLELALLSLSLEMERKTLGEGEGLDPSEILFRYLDLKEQDQWKSREWGDPPSLGPDY